MEKKIYFISDIHLGSKFSPSSNQTEKKVVRWMDSIKDSASELYLLGDILDYWYEYRYVVPKGFVRFFGKIAELADSGIKIYWFIGNHDIWMFDYFPKELGVEIIDGYLIKELAGKRFFLSHGDGIGKLSPGFKFLRSLFRNKFCQWLYAGIHPRWTIPFATQLSTNSRKSSYENEINPSKSLIEFSQGYNKEKIDYFVFGHTHEVVNKKLSNGSTIIDLGDWLQHFSYGVFDGNKFDIEYFNESL